MTSFIPARVQQDFFAFEGGLDLVTPAMRIAPGRLTLCRNYEPGIAGGYSRIPGYERFDGRSRPSLATYQRVAATMTTTPAYGAALTIGAATCRYLSTITGGVLVSEVSGTIPANTAIMDGVTNRGTTAASVTPSTPLTALLDAQYKVDAAAYRRTSIQTVPGSGAIRGVWIYAGDVYAFRDNVGGTACVMHKATTGGWSAVALGEEVAFSNANTSVQEGDTLSQTPGTPGPGPVTATIKRVVVETGSLVSGVNTGRLILTGRAGGNFTAAAATSTGGGSLTLGGAATAIALSPGGRYRFLNWNFFGQQTSQAMYGVNGLDRAFEFDGTVFTPISTGVSPDKPTHVAANTSYLFLSQGSSLMYSSPGEPYIFSATVGGGEIAVGDTVTGLVPLPGEAIGVLSRNSTKALVGTGPDDWTMQNIAPENGAIQDTIAQLRDAYYLDDRGLTSIQASQNYGNFEWGTVSRGIQPLIDSIRGTTRCAVAVRAKNQYRLFTSSGQVLYMTPAGRNPTFTVAEYSFVPYCACSGEDSTGAERIFVGAEDGYVYEIDVGSTFDGSEIESMLKLAYNNTGGPRMIKRFRRGVLEMSAVSYASLRYVSDLSWGSVEKDEHSQDGPSITGTGGVWDVSLWDSFIYDGTQVAAPVIELAGSGINMSMLFYQNTKYDFGHTLQGMTVLYSPRRLER